MQKITKKSPSAHHRTTVLGFIFATKVCMDNRKKNLLNSNIFSSPNNMANFGQLPAEIGLPVWGTPTNFNRFRVLPSLLQRHCSTLHDAWLSPGLVHYIHIFGGCCPLKEFCQVQNSLYVPSLVFSYIGSVTARNYSGRRQPTVLILAAHRHMLLSDIAVFVLKRDVKL